MVASSTIYILCWESRWGGGKVSMFEMETFLYAPTSHKIWNTLVQDDFQIQIVFVVTFLIIFGDCMNILFIVKVKILYVSKWSYRSLINVDYCV